MREDNLHSVKTKSQSFDKISAIWQENKNNPEKYLAMLANILQVIEEENKKLEEEKKKWDAENSGESLPPFSEILAEKKEIQELFKNPHEFSPQKIVKLLAIEVDPRGLAYINPVTIYEILKIWKWDDKKIIETFYHPHGLNLSFKCIHNVFPHMTADQISEIINSMLKVICQRNPHWRKS